MSDQSRNKHLKRFEGLIAAGEYFEAHEEMEAVWIAEGRASRHLWRGLTQLAVALTHASRGNLRGAGRVFTKARENLPDSGNRDPELRAVVEFACRRYRDLVAERRRAISDGAHRGDRP